MFTIDIVFLCGLIAGGMGQMLIRWFSEEKRIGEVPLIAILVIFYSTILVTLKGVLNG